MPHHVEPMLATLSHLPPDPRAWAFEYKWDGVRALAYHEPRSRRGDARWLIESRNQLDITRRYPELRALRDTLRKHDAVLDGEIVALDEDDRPSFARLQRRMHVNGDARIESLAREVPILYVLFDLLYLDGQSLMDRPYPQRRQALEKLRLSGPAWQVTPSHIGRGSEMLDAARRHGMEGVVAKRLDSVYEPGRRSNCWLKIKIVQRQEFVLGGWTGEATGLPDRIGTMLIGYYDKQGKLHYAGHVGTGLSGSDHPVLVEQFRKLARASSPFVEKLPSSRRGGMKIQYLEPRLVAEVEYRRWPAEGLVQQASFKGLREDKHATEVVRELTSG
jgi:bifunctional non-homologous end joining protein LigD